MLFLNLNEYLTLIPRVKISIFLKESKETICINHSFYYDELTAAYCEKISQKKSAQILRLLNMALSYSLY